MLRYSAIGVVIGLLAATGLQASTDPVKEIATGWGYTCALVSSGAVYCWGTAWVNGSDTNSASPVLVNGLSKVKAIGAGLGNTCAIDLTGQTWCWGTDWKETIERKGLVKTRIPKLMEGLPSASQIAVGWSHICVISEVDGSVWCWGSNGVGELGNGTTDEEEKPVRVKNLAGATSIAAGVSNTCAVVAHDEVYCWGRDRQRGPGAIVNSSAPVKVKGVKNVTKVVNGRNCFCSLTSDGKVICFGSNIFLQLGTKRVGQRYSPPVRSSVAAATDIAANLFGACAVLASKKVSCWGDTMLPDAQQVKGKGMEPTEVAALDDVKNIELGLRHACAVLYSGRVKCWGGNGSGELGNGETSDIDVTRPIEVIGLPR